jgi:hypothetical protein
VSVQTVHSLMRNATRGEEPVINASRQPVHQHLILLHKPLTHAIKNLVVKLEEKNQPVRFAVMIRVYAPISWCV